MRQACTCVPQVEGDAKSLRNTTEQLAERTEALKKELATQKEEFSQRLFEVQQENSQVSYFQTQDLLPVLQAALR